MRKDLRRLTLNLVGDEATLNRLLEFLAFFHFNGGHSGTFAMPFDGDGADVLRVEGEFPLPEERINGARMIPQAGTSVEIALGGGIYGGFTADFSKQYRAVGRRLYDPEGKPCGLMQPSEDE